MALQCLFGKPFLIRSEPLFTLVKRYFGQNDLRLPNKLLPMVFLFSLVVFYRRSETTSLTWTPWNTVLDEGVGALMFISDSDPFWNVTWFCEAKPSFWPKTIHGYLICSPAPLVLGSSFSIMLFSYAPSVLNGITMFEGGLTLRWGPFSNPFWNWTKSLRCFFLKVSL